MKKNVLLAGLLFIANFLLHAQNASISWGDEFKIKKGSYDLEVIYADKTGVYVKEAHYAGQTLFMIGASLRRSATLIKLDKSLTEEYRQDFNKELKGKNFELFFFLKNKLFILAKKYNDKDKTLSLHAAEIDKKTGEFAGNWMDVTSWQKQELTDNIKFNTSYNVDSTRLIFVSTVEGKERNIYEVKQFDEKLYQVGKTLTISNEFDPKTFLLEDVIYTLNEKVILVGRIYEYEEGKKKKSKFLEFSNYNIRIYTRDGLLQNEINTDIPGKWMMSTKVLQMPNSEIVLAAYYSNEKKGKEINGFMLQRISSVTGEVISSSVKEINMGMINSLDDTGADDSEEDEESKKEKKERKRKENIQEDEEGFSKHLVFRNFLFTPDSGLVIISESYHEYDYSTTSRQSMPGGGSTTTTDHFRVYQCGNITMSKIDTGGNIIWMHVLPKNQREVIRKVGGYAFASHYNARSGGMNYFTRSSNLPFFAGFGVLTNNNFLTIIFNDHQRNESVLELKQKCRPVSYYAKSDCFGVKLDVLTGKYTRKSFFSNTDMPVAMPRLGSAFGNLFYVVGRDERVFGKSKIAIAKISVKK